MIKNEDRKNLVNLIVDKATDGYISCMYKDSEVYRKFLTTSVENILGTYSDKQIQFFLSDLEEKTHIVFPIPIPMPERELTNSQCNNGEKQ